MLVDKYNRPIRDLRISLTDRCNFRCFYCRNVVVPTAACRSNILTLEEIAYICDIFVSLGIEKIRLTGGEPLLRKGIEDLITEIARLKMPTSGHGLRDLAITTNGTSFPDRANSLRNAGLDRVTFSLDSLKHDNFTAITGVDKLDEVLDAIDTALAVGFVDTKVNVVVIRGCNDHELVDFARYARQKGLSIRFIEFMPLDSGRKWKRGDLVSGREILDRVNKVFPICLAESSRGRETAWKYRFVDGAKGEIGIISAVTDAFCGACSRIRLTADGQIRTCLFSTAEYDLRGLLRNGGTRSEIIGLIRSAVAKKEFGHTINTNHFEYASRSMSAIGG
ncbi:MAG: GTP 3',8-cyclase MoaA [Chloracidobacterium sp.]|nr:GTP 3',8-cyclase MoaA [Chloracidobacterium sp.]